MPRLSFPAGRALVAVCTLAWGAFPVVCLAGSPVESGVNFVASDPAFARVAEQAREESARFWSGRPLPGRWSSPCPIDARLAPRPASGRTSFVFDRGEVSGWRMSLHGRREELLGDVLPHEVDHMVRASLTRRPIPRWLDEGAATLMESAASHSRIRERLRRFLVTPITAGWLDAPDYPESPEEIDCVYTVGFSLVEYLLQQRDAETLLAFQADPRVPSEKLHEFYSLRVAELDESWRQWATERHRSGWNCAECGCTRHPGLLSDPAGSSGPQLQRPVLAIYTKRWCRDCERFWQDFRNLPDLRRVLLARFDVQVIDCDQEPEALRSGRVRVVPSFVGPFGCVAGYQGPEWLLNQIRAADDSAGAADDSPAAPLASANAPAQGGGALQATEAAPAPTRSPALSPLEGPTSAAGRSGAPVVPHIPWDGLGLLAQRAWHAVQWTGLIGGSLATGGVGALAVSLTLTLLRRRRQRRHESSANSVSGSASPFPPGGPAEWPAPFPRALDEARQLLQLRQSEGRVVVLDALRGMFLDDELDKLTSQGNAATLETLTRLRDAIDARVDAVAPLSTKLGV